MYKRQLFYLAAFGVASILLLGCRCKCDCINDRGCTLLTAAYKDSKDVIEHKKYCSTMNFSTDTIMQDSIHKFYLKYSTDSTYVFTADSIYKKDRLIIQDCIDKKLFEKTGYYCNCVK